MGMGIVPIHIRAVHDYHPHSQDWRATVTLIAGVSSGMGLSLIHLDGKFTHLDGKIDAQDAELRQAIENQGATTASSIERLYILLAEGKQYRVASSGRKVSG